MNRNEFRDVFLAWVKDGDKIAMLSDLGIGHYNSPWARTLQIAMTVMEPLHERLAALEARVSALAQAVAALSAPQPHIQTPIPTSAPKPLVAVAHEDLEAALTPPKKRGRPTKRGSDAVEVSNG